MIKIKLYKNYSVKCQRDFFIDALVTRKLHFWFCSFYLKYLIKRKCNINFHIKVVSKNFIIASNNQKIDFWWENLFDLLIWLTLSLYGYKLLWHWHVTNVDLNVCINKRLEKINLKPFEMEMWMTLNRNLKLGWIKF